MLDKTSEVKADINDPLYKKVLEEIYEVIENNEITVLELEEIILPEIPNLIKRVALVPYKKRMSRAQRLLEINN